MDNTFVFGASRLGEVACEFLKDMYEIKGFIDNDPAKVKFKNFKVYKIDEIKNKSEFIIIASSYWHEISLQLEKLGYFNYKIFNAGVFNKNDLEIESKKFWENRYSSGGNSGEGSYNELALFKAEVLNKFIVENKVNSVIEWGVGDGNQLALINYENYIGYDVSETALNICRKKFSNDINKEFRHYNGEKITLNSKVDLTLSLDVIYHLVEDEVFKIYMQNLFGNSNDFVCIYSSNFNRYHTSHVKDRMFTSYVEEHFAEWELIEFIENPLKETGKSDSDFYFYKRIVTKP